MPVPAVDGDLVPTEPILACVKPQYSVLSLCNLGSLHTLPRYILIAAKQEENLKDLV